jgi:uncharacterized protein
MTTTAERPCLPLSDILSHSLSVFKCGEYSIHGASHWHQVYKNALDLSQTTGADPCVIGCFAYLHDSCREDDAGDPRHGIRAADSLPFVKTSIPSLSELTDAQMKLLDYAIRHHVDGDTSTDPTIGTCWDADRLDLGRVGIIPDEKYMSTLRGKELARGG